MKMNKIRNIVNGANIGLIMLSVVICLMLNSCSFKEQELGKIILAESNSINEDNEYVKDAREEQPISKESAVHNEEQLETKTAETIKVNLVQEQDGLLKGEDTLPKNEIDTDSSWLNQTEDLSILGFVLDKQAEDKAQNENTQNTSDIQKYESTQNLTDAKENENTQNLLEVQKTDNTQNSEDINKPTSITDTISTSVEVFLSSLSKPQEGKLLSSDGAVTLYYYMQTDSRWSKKYYGGTDTIGKYACGPSCMSIVISSLTSNIIDPVQMSKWSYDNGYWYKKSGSLHSLIPDAAIAFGLKVKGVNNDENAASIVKEALLGGKLVVALMGKGHFTKGGHFIVLRGIDADGKILVADPASSDRTNTSWDLSLIVGEARAFAGADGPFWVISN